VPDSAAVAEPGWRKPFNAFWGSQSVSQLTAQSINVCLPLLAINKVHVRSSEVGLIAGLQYAPVLIITPLLGAYIDGQRRLPWMRTAQWIRALSYGLAAAAAAAGFLSLGTLIALVLIAGAFTATFDVATQAFVPNLVPKENLAFANSRIQGSLSFAQVFGPTIGGLLVAIRAPWQTFALLAAGFGIAALLLLRVQADERPVKSDRDTGVIQNLPLGFRAVWSSSVLSCLSASTIWFNIFEQALITTFLTYAVRSLGIPSGTVGIMIGTGAFGSIIGALGAGRRLALTRGARSLILSSGLACVAPAALLTIRGDDLVSLGIAAAFFFIYGIGVASFNVQSISIRQATIAPELRGKTGAAYRFFAYGALMVGGLASSVFVAAFGLLGSLGLSVTALVAGWAGMSLWFRRVFADRNTDTPAARRAE
jgi:MFS family permease